MKSGDRFRVWKEGFICEEEEVKNIVQEENKLRWELGLMHENKDEELKSLRLHLKTLQGKIWEIRMKRNIYYRQGIYLDFNQSTAYADPLTKEQLMQMQRLIGAKSEAIRNLEEEKYNQIVDREKLVVLHKYQESGVEVHHAYTKYIQSENLKSLRDLPHSYKLLVEDLVVEVERKLHLKKFMEEQKKRNEELINDTRKKLEEATSFHHSLQKQVDQLKN